VTVEAHVDVAEMPPARGQTLTWLALSLSTAFLMETLDSTIIVAAIPAIAADFGVEPLRINLAISLYLVALAAFIPASGWVADRFGAKRVFLWAMAGFMLTSLGAALAHDLTTLVVLRVAQGVAGALMTPVGRLLLIRSAPRAELASAITWMSAPSLIGPVLGPLVGGYIVTYATWPWIFAVKIPFGIIGLVVAARMLPADDASRPAHGFDGLGFATCAVFFAASQLALDQLVHRFLPVGVVAALVLALPLSAIVFMRHARRHPAPALDTTLLRLRLFRIGFFAGGLSRIGLNAVPFLLQLQLQLGFGWSAADAGWVVFAVAASALVLKPLMRQTLALLGFRATLAGNAMLGAVTTVALGFVTPETSFLWLMALVTVFGIVRSLQFNAVNTLLYADVPRPRQSASTALGGVGQQIAMALGISVAAVLVAQFAAFGLLPSKAAISAAFHVMAALSFLSGLAFLRLDADDGAEVSRNTPRR
jgi:EmrB/QacA subfamily drug resistance transporter